MIEFYKADPTGLAFSMKLHSGGDLREIERLGWDQEKKIKVMIDICIALEYSHVNGVIHREWCLRIEAERARAETEEAYAKYEELSEKLNEAAAQERDLVREKSTGNAFEYQAGGTGDVGDWLGGLCGTVRADRGG